jgi:hypothetical protein
MTKEEIEIRKALLRRIELLESENMKLLAENKRLHESISNVLSKSMGYAEIDMTLKQSLAIDEKVGE